MKPCRLNARPGAGPAGRWRANRKSSRRGMRARPDRPAAKRLAGALALGLSLVSGPSFAGLSAKYGSDDAHLDALLGQCQAQFDAYFQVLSANNPPENVYFTIRSFVTSLN